jgi:hypothetical protein
MLLKKQITQSESKKIPENKIPDMIQNVIKNECRKAKFNLKALIGKLVSRYFGGST